MYSSKKSKKRPLPELPDAKSTYSLKGNNVYEEIEGLYQAPQVSLRKENEYLDPTILDSSVLLENSFYEA